MGEVVRRFRVLLEAVRYLSLVDQVPTQNGGLAGDESEHNRNDTN
jgi:hypothetical protein